MQRELVIVQPSWLEGPSSPSLLLWVPAFQFLPNELLKLFFPAQTTPTGPFPSHPVGAAGRGCGCRHRSCLEGGQGCSGCGYDPCVGPSLALAHQGLLLGLHKGISALAPPSREGLQSQGKILGAGTTLPSLTIHLEEVIWALGRCHRRGRCVWANEPRWGPEPIPQGLQRDRPLQPVPTPVASVALAGQGSPGLG